MLQSRNENGALISQRDRSMGKMPTNTETLSVSLLTAEVCIILIATGIAILAGLLVIMMRKTTTHKSTSDKLPEKWVKIGEIKELHIYPIKSLPAISVNEAVLGRLGLKAPDNPLLRDRVFAVINEKGVCVSQRDSPQFAIFAHTRVAFLEGGKLRLSYIKNPALDIIIDIPTSEDPSRAKIAKIFEEKVKAVDCGDEVASWLSRLTETPGLRLVCQVLEEPQRGLVSRNKKFDTYRVEHTGAFQEDTSYMIMTDESVAALNAQLERPVSHANFRPNIVVSGTPEPFSEDFWGYIRIGLRDQGPVLMASRPCVRCRLTTIDPETATFRKDGEPLKTLYKMKRQVGNAKTSKMVSKSAVMGVYFGMFQGQGEIIRVGDPVFVASL